MGSIRISWELGNAAQPWMWDSNLTGALDDSEARRAGVDALLLERPRW